MCERDAVVLKNLYFMFTIGRRHNLHLGVPGLLKTCLTHSFSLTSVVAPGRVGLELQKKLSSVTLLLLNACSGTLSHVEEEYRVPGLHVYLANEEGKASLNGLLKTETLRGMMKERISFAVDAEFSFVVTFTGRSPGFLESCKLTWMNVLPNKMRIQINFGHRGEAWVERGYSHYD